MCIGVHEESSKLYDTYVCALENQTPFRTLFILNPLTYHVLQSGNPAKFVLIGHPSIGKNRGYAKQASHLPLHFLRMFSFKCRAPGTVSSHRHSQYPSTTRYPPRLTTSSGKLCAPASVSANLDASR